MTKKFDQEMEKLLQKAKKGGQVTLSDLENLQRVKSFGRISAKTALKKAQEGQTLNQKELEVLATDPKLAVEYAQLTKKPFPECEEILLKYDSSYLIQKYFQELFPQVNKKYERWLIKTKQTEMILNYCSDVLKKRWREGEEVILSDDGWRRCHWGLGYQKLVVRGRWLELEQIMFGIKNDRRELAKGYFKNIGLGRHEDLERRLLKKGTPQMLHEYALYCVGGRLPDSLHNKMILVGKGWSRKYLKGLEKRKRMMRCFFASMTDDEREEMLRPEMISS